METEVLEKRKTSSDLGVKDIGFAFTTEEKEASNQRENFAELIKEAQEIGSELYKKGLIAPYDPIR
ncbi:3-phosphoshikimate 1-carboxyvinyltransferase [Capnocytophaga sputigena]|uniref:3-phosphoshikimate 1-carboxyvinyltransferase n=1 Tax=Capnocytophaga sputigena TaxID=1019 RepID=UPI0028D1F9D5|nr:3-phosphoshikimate 1-carboxyvinyltransferase [Capnocytophaga sputigena]